MFLIAFLKSLRKSFFIFFSINYHRYAFVFILVAELNRYRYKETILFSFCQCHVKYVISVIIKFSEHNFFLFCGSAKKIEKNFKRINYGDREMRGFRGPIEEIILSVSRLNFSDISSRYTRSRSKCVRNERQIIYCSIQNWWIYCTES